MYGFLFIKKRLLISCDTGIYAIIEFEMFSFLLSLGNCLTLLCLVFDEPQGEKSSLRRFRPCPTQTGLYKLVISDI